MGIAGSDSRFNKRERESVLQRVPPFRHDLVTPYAYIYIYIYLYIFDIINIFIILKISCLTVVYTYGFCTAHSTLSCPPPLLHKLGTY